MRRSVITHRRSWEWGSSASHWTLSYTRARVGFFLNIVFTEHAFSSIHKTKIVCPFANSAIWKLLHNYFQLEKYTRKRKETQTSAALLHQSPYKNTVIISSFFLLFHFTDFLGLSSLCVLFVCSTGRTTCVASTGCSDTPLTPSWWCWLETTTSVFITSKTELHRFFDSLLLLSSSCLE